MALTALTAQTTQKAMTRRAGKIRGELQPHALTNKPLGRLQRIFYSVIQTCTDASRDVQVSLGGLCTS